MITIVIVEIVCAVFLTMLFIAQRIEGDRSKSSRLLNICILLVLFELVIDVMAYTFVDDSTPFLFRYIVCLLAYAGEGIYFIGFAYYSEEFISEKTRIDPRIFRILRIAEGVWIAATAAAFFAGKIIVYENGIEAADYGYPLYLSVYQIIVMLYTPVIALVYRKKIGREAVALLSFFNITPILGILLEMKISYDYSYVLGAATLFFIAEMLQRKQVQAQQTALAAHDSLVLNNRRILALEDSFEVLYDVELETGRYDIFVKGQTFGDVNNNLINNNSFFDDVEKNLSVVYPEDQQGNYDTTRPEFIREALAENDHFDRYYRLLVDGKPAWARMRIVYKDAEKKNIIIGVFNAEGDVEAKQITEKNEQLELQQKQLEEANHRNELLYDITNAIRWSYIVDADDNIISYSYAKHADEIVYSEHFRDPMAWAEILHPDDRDRTLEAFFATVRDRSGKTPYEVTYRCRGTQGGYVWLKVSGRIILGEDGVRELFGISVDVTSQMEREREQQKNLEHALETAQTASQAKTEFLFNMSHDIRTPMNAILGYTDIALNHVDEPERVSDSLKKIKLSGGHLLSLINDILEMSRIEAGKLEIVNAPLDAYEVTEEITTMSQALAATKDIHFTTVTGEIPDPYVYADELHTNQIIINLISNAIKYTPAGGNVEYRIEQISAPVDGTALYRLTVKDDGIGMSEEFQQHLFENFARENSAEVSRQEGAGLGLSIVKRILDLIGGTVSVQSRKGEGSVFTVELPLRVMDDAAIAEYRAKKDPDQEHFSDAVLRGRKVLLVEDNEMNREIATEILQDAGLSVETAGDGSVAVRMLEEKGPDCYDFVLMDIQMPVMNGYEATRAIREMYPDAKLPIIALSANAFEEDKAASIAAGMNDHVAKPIRIPELLGALEKCI